MLKPNEQGLGAHLLLCRFQAYAYIEFAEVDAVGNAVLLDGTELRGRPLKVSPFYRSCMRRRNSLFPDTTQLLVTLF